MPVTRDSPSIQGDVPGPDPARAPPSKAVAGGVRLSGAAGGGLPCQARSAMRRAAAPRAACLVYVGAGAILRYSAQLTCTEPHEPEPLWRTSPSRPLLGRGRCHSDEPCRTDPETARSRGSSRPSTLPSSSASSAASSPSRSQEDSPDKAPGQGSQHLGPRDSVDLRRMRCSDGADTRRRIPRNSVDARVVAGLVTSRPCPNVP